MPIPGGPFYTASKHAILGIMRSLHLPLVFASALSIASSPVWNSRYQYVLSLTILYRYRYRPSSGRSDSGGNLTHTSITHRRGHFSCCLESGSWDERWWSTYGAGQGVYKMMDDRVNALLGLGLIGWLGVRNDIIDSLSCSGSLRDRLTIIVSVRIFGNFLEDRSLFGVLELLRPNWRGILSQALRGLNIRLSYCSSRVNGILSLLVECIQHTRICVDRL